MSTLDYSSTRECQAAEPARGLPTPPAARLRVLHVNSGNLYGGVETILVTLARLRELCPRMEPHFALCHEGRLSRELTACGAPVYLLGNVRISRPWTGWRARRCLRQLLARTAFDIVICHMPWSLAVFGKAVREAGQRLGFWAHAFHEGRNWLERSARQVRPDVAIGNSHFTQAGLANLFPGVASGVVYPPVALTDSPDAGEWRRQARQQQGVADETVVIIQVSRLEACKGHLLHLEALAQLKDLPTRWVCWMAGGPQRPEERAYLSLMESTARQYGLEQRVRFLGQRADVPQLLAGADIFCQPNHTPDSFGISFIEALWAGRPVITTAMGGAKEIIDDSCGSLVAPGQPAALAAALRRLIEDPELRARQGRAGATRAIQLCEPAAQMKKLSDLTLPAGRRAGKA